MQKIYFQHNNVEQEINKRFRLSVSWFMKVKQDLQRLNSIALLQGEKKLNYQKSKQLNSQGSGRYGRLMCVANCHKKGDNRQE